jgi:hypothetical protein
MYYRYIFIEGEKRLELAIKSFVIRENKLKAGENNKEIDHLILNVQSNITLQNFRLEMVYIGNSFFIFMNVKINEEINIVSWSTQYLMTTVSNTEIIQQ